MKKLKSSQTTLFWSLGLFGFMILSLSIVRQSHIQIERSMGNAYPSPPLEITNVMFDQVPLHSNYQLPLPGILPTHPLYVGKMMIDQVRLTLASTPPAKAAILLEYANTRIAAADALARKGYLDPAVSVATKGEIYLFQAINAGAQLDLKQQKEWYEKLKPVILKHEEVIERIHLIGNDTTRNQTNAMQQNLGIYRSQIESLSGTPFGLVRPEDYQDTEATSSASVIQTPSM